MIKGRQRYEGMNYLSGDSTKDSTELFIKLQASWLATHQTAQPKKWSLFITADHYRVNMTYVMWWPAKEDDMVTKLMAFQVKRDSDAGVKPSPQGTLCVAFETKAL